MLHVVEDKLGEEEKEENEGYVVIDEEVVLDEESVSWLQVLKLLRRMLSVSERRRKSRI